MKINPYGQVPNVYRKQLDKLQPKGEVAKKTDQLEISTEAKLMQQETKFSIERKEKLEQLKEKIQSGEYVVNSQEVARKFYEFWNQ